MKIESIKLKNFKALKDVEMKNGLNFCVAVGAKGSGKSTLFSLFGVRSKYWLTISDQGVGK